MAANIMPNKGIARSAIILLEPMQQQAEARAPEEDWTGVASSAKRRRLQNRLNQRASRKRKVAQFSMEKQGPTRVMASKKQDERTPQHLESSVSAGSESPAPPNPRPRLASPETYIKLRLFAQQAYQDYILSSPRPSVLHALIQLNVVNALASNARTLKLPVDRMCDKSLRSPFNSRVLPPSWTSYPPSLRPTQLQIAVPHHPWIDVFPIPQLRDNLIRACGTIDEEELNIDMVDVQDDTEKANMIVWGSPADPFAWEATVPFLRKWGWLLKGYTEVIEATNYWRERRDERRVAFEVS